MSGTSGRSSRNSRKKKFERQQAKRKMIVILTVFILSIGIFGGVSFYKRIEAKAEEKRIEEETARLEKERFEQEKIEQARLEEEKKKAEEEKKKQKYGVGPNGEAFAYDAKVIQDKLKRGDHSNNGEKIVFLTFDDGPSTTVTPEVLDVLKKNDVKGTFFVVGKQLENEKSRDLLKRIYDEGHAIGNHTYGHNYKSIYPNRTLNLNNFMSEINKTEDKIREVIGENFNVNVVRCPGGHMSWKGMSALDEKFKEENMASVDWNSLSKDAEGKTGKTPAELLEIAKKESAGKDIVVMLMHDTYGKENTAKMLDDLIKYYKSQGYEFKTLV